MNLSLNDYAEQSFPRNRERIPDEYDADNENKQSVRMSWYFYEENHLIYKQLLDCATIPIAQLKKYLAVVLQIYAIA